MPGSESSSGEPFDLRRIRRLAQLMNEQNLTEIDLQTAGTRLRLRRQRPGDVSAVEPRIAAASGAAPAPSSRPSAAPAPKDDGHVFIKSPMVGTFYTTPNPESPPFIKVGDHVGPETTVCLIEAMKVFNEIPAEVAGKILAVLVENGEPIEFGQPLFRVDPAG